MSGTKLGAVDSKAPRCGQLRSTACDADPGPFESCGILGCGDLIHSLVDRRHGFVEGAAVSGRGEQGLGRDAPGVGAVAAQRTIGDEGYRGSPACRLRGRSQTTCAATLPGFAGLPSGSISPRARRSPKSRSRATGSSANPAGLRCNEDLSAS